MELYEKLVVEAYHIDRLLESEHGCSDVDNLATRFNEIMDTDIDIEATYGDDDWSENLVVDTIKFGQIYSDLIASGAGLDKELTCEEEIL